MQWLVGRTFFVDGVKKTGVIFHCGDGYYYHKHDTHPNSAFVVLRCVKRKSKHYRCRGLAVMSRDGAYFVMTRGHWGHGRDFLFPQEMMLRSLIVHQVATGDKSPFPVIIRDVGIRNGFSHEVRSRLTSNRLRCALRKQRLLHVPPVAWNLAVLGAYLSMPQFRHVTETIDRNDNIYAGTCGRYADGTLSVVFISRRMMDFMSRVTKVFADGTFKKRPKKPPTSQIFIISTVWTHRATRRKHIITLARVFMQKRTGNAYKVLLNYLKVLMPLWLPRWIMCDHELAQVNAWREVFVDALIVTCLWHFAVDIFRYAKSLNLGGVMYECWEVDSIVRACCALPLVPNHSLREGVLALGIWARIMGIMRLAAVRDLFSYIERQWFPAEGYLSVCNEEDRTNNVSESVNASLGLEVVGDRPNAYVLIDAFRRLEDQAVLDLFGLHEGRDVGRPVLMKTLRNDERIMNLTESFLNGQMNIVQFLFAASRTLQAPYDHVFQN